MTMAHLHRYSLLFLAVACLLAPLSGCGGGGGSTSSGGDGDGPLPESGQYLIEGYLGANFVEGGFGVWVGRIDPEDDPASGCTITINGAAVQERTLLSTDDDAFYSNVDFDYEAGVDYTIQVTKGERSATCSFTGPSYPIITMTQPTGDTFVPGEALLIAWEYDSGTADDVYINVYGDDDELLIAEVHVAGTTTSYTIPGSVTEDWGAEQEVFITVDAGEAFFPFTGSLAYTGSGVVTIFTGDAEILYPGEATEYTVTVWVDDESIPADGSTTTVHVEVSDETYYPCPDGSTVTLSCSPPGAVTFTQATLSALGGEASTIVTAGTTPGTVSIEAECLGGSGTAYLDLSEPPQTITSITVGPGEYPQLDWDDPVEIAGFFIREKAGLRTMKWAFGSYTGVYPPITYGTLPEGCMQTWPLAAAPSPMTGGTTYQFGFIDAAADTTLIEYTP
jgi:hypothetical protein